MAKHVWVFPYCWFDFSIQCNYFYINKTPLKGYNWPLIKGYNWPLIKGYNWPLIKGYNWPLIKGYNWPLIKETVMVWPGTITLQIQDKTEKLKSVQHELLLKSE